VTNIVHIAGMDKYNSHDSGNYLVFKQFRNLPYNSHHVLGLSRQMDDPDTSFIPLLGEANQQGLEFKIKPDILVLYDTLLEPETIKRIYDVHKCPVVFVTMVHDFFTGGCVYPGDCDRFTAECGACPQKNSSDTSDESNQIMLRKLSCYKEIPLVGVGVSSYARDLMKKSYIFKNRRTEVIPLTTVEEIPEAPLTEKQARQALGISKDKFVIFWGTTQPDTPRKGGKLAVDILKQVSDTLGERSSEILLVTAGPEPTTFSFSQLPIKHKHLGYFSTRDNLTLAYKAASVALQTTIEDAGPMMVCECLVNETPVISFDRCIATDVIQNGINGYVVPTYDCGEMASKICKMFISKSSMSSNCLGMMNNFNKSSIVQEKWTGLIESIKP
jgi:glycosyltransferase involved in cell wall biosynthesis